MSTPSALREVRRYFYDCEFVEDGTTIDLVSIGVVDETGREFYAVSTEFDDSKAISWVRRHVLDKLPSPADPAWRSRERIRDDLLAFLLEPDCEIELWAWMAAYDHVVLVQLWGDMRALPRSDAAVHARAASTVGGRGSSGSSGAAGRISTTPWPTPDTTSPSGRSSTGCDAHLYRVRRHEDRGADRRR